MLAPATGHCLAGYTGGLRRSELAASNLENLEWVAEGTVLILRRSKTDQAGQEGRHPQGSAPDDLPRDGVAEWIAAASIT